MSPHPTPHQLQLSQNVTRIASFSVFKDWNLRNCCKLDSDIICASGTLCRCFPEPLCQKCFIYRSQHLQLTFRKSDVLVTILHDAVSTCKAWEEQCMTVTVFRLQKKKGVWNGRKQNNWCQQRILCLASFLFPTPFFSILFQGALDSVFWWSHSSAVLLHRTRCSAVRWEGGSALNPDLFNRSMQLMVTTKN